VIQDPDYLNPLNLSKILDEADSSHTFYFASQHGPSQSMKPTKDATEASLSLNVTVPRTLIEISGERKSGLTLPASSRVFSGLLSKTEPIVKVSSDSALEPLDFYGEHKAELLLMAESARQNGARIHTPILFNHDSLFKRKGYVGWALAENIHGIQGGAREVTFRNPSALVDLSDAVEVCQILLAEAFTRSETTLISSGVTRSLLEILMDSLKFLELEFDLGEPFSDRTGQGELFADSSHSQTLTTSYERTISALLNMLLTLSPVLQSRFEKIHLRLLEALPKSVWGQFPRSLNQLLPIEPLQSLNS
jgi:GDP-D-mannose dehydratase